MLVHINKQNLDSFVNYYTAARMQFKMSVLIGSDFKWNINCLHNKRLNNIIYKFAT